MKCRRCGTERDLLPNGLCRKCYGEIIDEMLEE